MSPLGVADAGPEAARPRQGPPALLAITPALDERAWRRPAAIAAAVIVAAVIASWAANVAQGPGAVLTAVGQLAGFGCSLAALLTVALMARIPVVTNLIGADRSVRWHRWAATATVAFLALHIGAIVAGYAAADRSTLLHETATLLTTYPWMLCALVAAILLFGVAGTSVRRARRRMRYETWLFAHWYVYPALFLAFGHEITNGASFVHNPAAIMVWTWLHVLVACTLGWYRVVLPAWRMLTHPLAVEQVDREGPAAVTLTLRGRRLADYGAEAGQAIRIRFLIREGWWQSHPFSFSAPPRPRQWRITVAVAGDHTASLQHLRPGTRAVVSGVYGHLIPTRRRSRGVVLIGGGSGIVPLRALLEAFPAGTDARVLYRARRPEDLMLEAELDRLATQRGAYVNYLFGRRHVDPRQDFTSPAVLGQLVPDLGRRDAFVCGRAGFVEAVERSLRANGVPAEHIHTERFDS